MDKLGTRHRPLITGVLALLLLAAAAASAQGQSVAGRVLDAATGEPVAAARVALLRLDGTRLAEVIAGDDGTFRMAAPRTGGHRIEARALGFATTITPIFRLEAHDQLIVDITVTQRAIPLDPLVIVGRQRDLRGEPTVEGFYARQQLLPPIGNSRAITRNDGEMINARDPHDVLTWLPRPHCLVVFWNGHLVTGPLEAGIRLQTLQVDLEGIEFYRYNMDAPAPFRVVPPYLMECMWHSVLALWSRTGYYGDQPPVTPASHRVSIAPTGYHIAGSRAPSIGHGVELSAHWPVRRRTAVGVALRRTAHMLPAAVTMEAVPPIVAPLYRTPPGKRPLTLWTAGMDARVAIPRSAPLWPVITLRLQAAHRSFTLTSSSERANDVTLSSLGAGIGIGAGAELPVQQRFALHAAVAHERLFFGPYSGVEHRLNRTSAHWGGTSLRIGAGYALLR